MSSHINPFNPGAGQDPPYLAGREGELDKFSVMLQAVKAGKARNIMMHGIRGVGKTVLLHKFVQICLDNKFLPIARFQHSEKYSEPTEFFRMLQYDLDNMVEAFSKREKTKKKIRTFADYIKPENLEILGIVSYKPSYTLNNEAPFEDQMARYLMKKWKVIQEGGYEGAVFLLDEFHTIKNLKQNNWHVLTDFTGAINDVQTRGCRYSFVLCGLPILPENVKIARSYSERMFTSVPITSLNIASARKAISEPLIDTDWKFSDDLVDSIVRDTDGYPYFIQFFCSEIINRINKEEIGVDDYESVKNSIKDSLWLDFFDYRMKALSSGQRQILSSMASIQKGKITFSSIYNLANMSKGTFSKHLKRLEEKGLIYRPERGIYQLLLPMLREYLLRRDSN